MDDFMRISHLAFLFFLAAAMTAQAQSPVASGSKAARAPRPVGHPVLPGIWSLDGHDPALPADDLEPLRQIVDKATVVGLGEAMHTSGGFHEMKDRSIRFLVEKMGFRVVAIESNWLPADRVAAYVQTCEGTPEDAMKGLFGVWQSAEIRDLVQWMCEWNRSHPKPKDRLSFFGFDIQQPEDDRRALAAFLGRLGMADSPSLAALQDCAGQSYAATSDARYASCTAGVGQIDTYFQRNPASIIRQSSKKDFEIAKLNLAGLRAWEEEIYYYTSDAAKSQDARDQAMAYAFGVLRGQRFPKARTVIWAHNFHLAKEPLYGQHPMGSYLVQSLGKSYVDFALVAHQMNIDWLGVGCGPRDLPFPNSVENRLHELGPPTLLVDLAFPGTTDPYLPPGEYGLGFYRMDPRQFYNGIFYLDISPKMTPLAWPSCQ
jgi:erythromycin esterase-like protein